MGNHNQCDDRNLIENTRECGFNDDSMTVLISRLDKLSKLVDTLSIFKLDKLSIFKSGTFSAFGGDVPSRRTQFNRKHTRVENTIQTRCVLHERTDHPKGMSQ
jgi:hypothetical protein